MERTSAKRAQRQREVRRKKRFLAGFALLLLLCLFGGAYYRLYKYVHQVPDEVILDNIYIGNTEVSGMTAAEAETAVKKQLEEYGNHAIALSACGKTEDVTLSELGLGVDSLDKYIEKALAYGRDGGLWSSYRKIRQLSKEAYEMEVDYVIDAQAAGAVIEERIVPLENRAVNATIKRENGQFAYTDEEEGKIVDIAATIQKIEEYLNSSWNFRDGSLEAVEEVDSPTLTRAELETVQDVLGSFGTDAGDGDRAKNLENGAGLIDGTLILPGEEISVYELTAPYTTENGYYEATAYENGQVVPSIGGGICQVSTTLYNAALNAELEITQRAPHSMLVSYVKPSRDAAIAGDYKDLRFKNNYDTPIYLESHISQDNILVMNIYGQETRASNREVTYISETLKTTESEDPVKFVASSGREIGYMEMTTTPRSGIEAQLVKTVTIDGEVVSEDVINTSSYMATAGVYTVGTASSNENATAVMEKAIETQDKDKIEEAITQAQGMGE